MALQTHGITRYQKVSNYKKTKNCGWQIVRHLLIPCLVICVVVVLGGVDAVAVPPTIPPSDTGVGLFYDPHDFDDHSPAAIREHFREMVAAGCNTLTLYSRKNVNETAMQMDIAIEEGLVGRFPVILLPGDYDRESLDQFVQSAKEVSEHPAQWPEMVAYGPDEVEGGKQEDIAGIAEQVHAAGMRLCITTYAPLDYAGIADIIIPLDYNCSEEVRTGVRAAGSEFWAYSIEPFHSPELFTPDNYHVCRFIGGLWRWMADPEVWLAWSYMDSQGDTPALRGLGDGCLDYRMLRAIEEALAEQDNVEAREWLETLRANIPWNPYSLWWPPESPPNDPTIWDDTYAEIQHYYTVIVANPLIIEIMHPRNNRAIFSTNPLIQVSITDADDGVNETSIELEIDGAPVVGFAYDPGSGLLTYEASLAEGAHQVTVRAENNNGQEAEKTHSFRILQKSFDAGLHLFSLPYTYGPGGFPTPDSLFGLSPGDVAMHRWWPEDNNVNKYRTYPDNYGTFNPPDAMGGDPIVESPPAGLGYFIHLPQDATVQEPGTTLDGGVTTYEIELKRGLVPPRGWSMIGCPFSRALDWGSVEFVTDGQAQSITEAVEDGVTDGILWEFVSTGSGGYYDFPYDPLSATLEPFKGYWVHVWEDTTLRLNALAVGGAGVTPADSLGNFESDEEWQLQIIASAGGDLDPSNYIGIASHATSGYDPGLDVTEPPSVGGAVQCYQPRADWDEYSGNYARDIRSTVAGSQTWDVEVSCQLDRAPVKLTWPELNSVVPGAVKFMLEDVDTGQQVYMRTATGYSFTSPEGGGVRHLRITAYDDSVTSLTLTGVSAQAMSPSGGAVITYSLSKPATVAAEICNISGVIIKGLGERSSSGNQVEMVLWDGRSDHGTKVPAGRYLARITARAADGQTVQAIRPFAILP